MSHKSILIVGLNYSPEQVGIAKYTAEMAEYLARLGWSVSVIASVPHYPSWRVLPGFRASRYYRSRENGVDVVRCPLWVPSSPVGGVQRIISQVTFAISIFPVLMRHCFGGKSLVWTVAPSLVSAVPVIAMCKIFRIPSWLHIQDFEVDAVFQTGLLKNWCLKAFALKVEKLTLRSFDVVSTISERMLERLSGKGVMAARTYLFRNWVDTTVIFPQSSDTEFRRALNIPKEAIVALFSGTLGAKQGLGIIVEAARRFMGSSVPVHFVICGEGPMREELCLAAKSLNNLYLLPLQPRERLSELLSTADIHLLPQDPSVQDLVMPSKLLGMLASGRPVVTTAVAGTQLAELVRQCGRVAAPNDLESFSNSIVELADDPGLRSQLAIRARELALLDFGCQQVMQNFVHALDMLITKGDHDAGQIPIAVTIDGKSANVTNK